MNKKLEEAIIERDIIGTQLVKKNDELVAQDSKIKLLQLMLDTSMFIPFFYKPNVQNIFQIHILPIKERNNTNNASTI